MVPVNQEAGVCSACGGPARRMANGAGWFHTGKPCDQRNAPKGKYAVVPQFIPAAKG